MTVDNIEEEGNDFSSKEEIKLYTYSNYKYARQYFDMKNRDMGTGNNHFYFHF